LNCVEQPVTKARTKGRKRFTGTPKVSHVLCAQSYRRFACSGGEPRLGPL
jgi:hypothetical protein